MKRIESFSQEEKATIIGGTPNGAGLKDQDCGSVFGGGGCKEGCKPGCKEGCKESGKSTTYEPK